MTGHATLDDFAPTHVVNRDLVIGVDPGARTGLAVVDVRTQRIKTVLTCDWRKAAERLEYLIREYHPGMVVIERPKAHGVWGADPGQMLHRARSVGQCMQKSDDLAQRARELVGADRVRQIEPLKGGTKRAVSANVWRSMFSWNGKRVSHNARDAALLAYYGR